MNSKTRVFQAANTLLQQGVKPSWEKVREVLGGGSKSTIVPALHQYWKEKGWRALVEFAQGGTVSAGADDMVPRSQMEQELRVLQERLDAERVHLMIETDRIRQGIQAPVQKLKDDLLLAQARIAALERARR